MPKVKNMMETGLTVGPVHFEKGEEKEISDIKEGLFPQAIHNGSIKVMKEEQKKQARQESDEVAKEEQKPKKDEKKPEEKDKRQARVESDEMAAKEAKGPQKK